VSGGQGGYCAKGIGGTGGAGVDLQSGTLANTGTITGGAGGYYGNGNRGQGGTGVAVTGGTVIAGGIVSGGIGHLGGAGLTISGGAVTATGTISGGAGTDRNGDAVLFGRTAGTLTIDPGAVFNGVVAAKGGAGDLLILAAGVAATLTGLGTQFTHFATIQAAPGASWALAGANTLTASEALQLGGALTVTGTLASAGSATIGPCGTLAADTSGAILLAAATLSGGSLTDKPGGTLVVGATLAGAAPGTLTIGGGASIVGAGTITAHALSVAGALVAQGGTLTLDAAATGTGAVSIAAGATLLADAALAVASVGFAAGGGTLSLAQPGAVASPIAGFTLGDVVDLQNLLATTLTFAGGTLTLLDGSTPVDTLDFFGRYNADDFGLTSDNQGGTDIVYAAVSAPAWHSADPAWPAVWRLHG
jgi:hypothetical protein